MGELLELFGAFLDVEDLYSRYGLKGCLLFVFAVVAIIGVILALAIKFGS